MISLRFIHNAVKLAMKVGEINLHCTCGQYGEILERERENI
jgi:hypothetical protein